MHVTISKIDETWIKVVCDEPWMEHDISERFTFDMPDAKFDPRVIRGVWDGKIRLYNRKSKTLYLGLYFKLIELLSKLKFPYTVQGDMPITVSDVSVEDIQATLSVINPHSGKKPIEPYDYQVKAIHYMMAMGRSVCLAATAAGKSLIIYSACRIYQMLFNDREKRIIIIVPNVQLVEQMYADFHDYSDYEGSEWHVHQHCQRIHAKYTKHTTNQIVITTWQSLSKMPSHIINEAAAIFVDEVHGVRGKVLTDLMQSAVGVSIRHGLTGTLDGVECNELLTEGLLGPVTRIVTAKQLIDKGRASEINVKCLVMDYPVRDKQEFGLLMKSVAPKNRYHTEVEYIISHEKRNAALQNLVLCMKGNTLVLFDRVDDHGRKLYDDMKTRHTNTFFIVGEVEATVREQIRQIVEIYTDAIIYASYGTMSVGVSIKNLHNMVLGSSTKSKIRVLQSIGRMMRLHSSKDHATIWDLIDKIDHPKENYALDHAKERIAYYATEQFNVSFDTISI